MELFSNTGFEIGDKVFVVIDKYKCFGVVVKVDDKFDRIKVDFSFKSDKPVVEWFKSSFWSKV